MGVVGPPGCGKSTLFEGLSLIYTAGAKPERENSFPLSSILEVDVLLWQEFSWTQKMCAFEDLLQVTAGEQLAIRVPCAKPVQHRNTAPDVLYSLGAHQHFLQRCQEDGFFEPGHGRALPDAHVVTGIAARGQVAEVPTVRVLLR